MESDNTVALLSPEVEIKLQTTDVHPTLCWGISNKTYPFVPVSVAWVSEQKPNKVE